MNQDATSSSTALHYADVLDFLSRSSSFKSLSPPFLKRLIIPILGVAHYDTGQFIIRQGDRQVNVHLVYRGRVHGSRLTEEGGEYHFFIHEGEMFGELALHSSRTYTSNLRAVVPTICLTLELETLKVAMASDWRLAKAIFRVIGNRLAERLVPVQILRFPWTDSLKVLAPKIDAQHEHLFHLINQLGDALERASPAKTLDKVVSAILNDLLLYVDTHFHDEERLMADLGVPWLGEHKAIHHRLEAEIIDFKRKVQQSTQAENQRYMGLQLHKFLGDLLVNHVMNEDMKIKSWPAAAARDGSGSPPAA
ncbi:MAG: bacteriohemerythrin [Magnetococcales bacterium]|nr:bacteriohemerythrin [Magnetococcales bacterium]